MFGTASLSNSTLVCTYCLVFPLSGKKLYQDLKEKFGKKKLPPFQKGHMACVSYTQNHKRKSFNPRGQSERRALS